MRAVSDDHKSSLSYRDAGVDIAQGNRLVDALKPLAARTHGDGVLTGVGGFGALFEIPPGRFKRPVLVSGTDGVGTKLRLAIDSGIHDTIGIDLVAMCANDILSHGAAPLFFLDYYATGKLDVEVARSVVAGIAHGCELAGAALIGGETAEMPGMYAEKDYDLAGFCVGAVEYDAIIDGRAVGPGDAIIGLSSSGPHANGYSLIRKILARESNEEMLPALLAPTRIYVKSVLALIGQMPVHGIAHITGGGLTENIPRAMPSGTLAHLESAALALPTVFDWLQDVGRVAEDEMRRTFNCGVGMVVFVAADNADRALDLLTENGETPRRIGTVEACSEDAPRVAFA